MEWRVKQENINTVAKEFWKAADGKHVFAFRGPMGSGKTTFISALCHAKGVTGAVGSPTFSLINEYTYPVNETGREEKNELIYHLDLYRVKDEEEAVRAGVEDILYSGHYCLVEWPEKAPGLFPDDTMYIDIEVLDTHTRVIKIANN